MSTARRVLALKPPGPGAYKQLRLSHTPEDSLTLQCGYAVRRNGRDVSPHKRQKALQTCLASGRFTYRHLIGRINVLRIFTRKKQPSLWKLYDADMRATQQFVRNKRKRTHNPHLYKALAARTTREKA